MFNFIFEGKLGEILAPVTGASNALFLAIQHQKNSEVHSILLNSGPELVRAMEGGYAAIHVACRYNNNYALDLIMSKGVPADFPDTSGNTPMHYAAKYGNNDLVKILLERGCSPAKRNSNGQTPYDVASSHIIRQYLLPIQLQYERNEQENSGQMPGMPGMSGMPITGGAGMVGSIPGSTPGYGIPQQTPQQQQPPSPANANSQSFNFPMAQPQVGQYAAYPSQVSQQLPQPAGISTAAPAATAATPTFPIGDNAMPTSTAAAAAAAAAPTRSLVASGSAHLGQPPGGAIHAPVFSAPAVQPVRTGPLVASAATQGTSSSAQVGPAAVQGGPLGAQKQLGAPFGAAAAAGAIATTVAASASPAFTEVPTIAAPMQTGPPSGSGGAPPPAPVGLVFMNPGTAASALASTSSKSATGSSGSSGRPMTTKIIQPDGFHSSASDPELKAKYGHKIEIPNIAPPPTAPIPSTMSALHATGGAPGIAAPSMYAMYGGGAPAAAAAAVAPPGVAPAPPQLPGGAIPPMQGTVPNIYNRYVAYDPFTNSAVQPPQQAVQQQQQQAYAQPMAELPPTQTGPAATPSAYPPQPSLVNVPAMATAPPATGMPPLPPQIGGAGLPPRAGSGSSSPRRGNGGGDMNVNVFNPATDCDVTTLDASSSSVL